MSKLALSNGIHIPSIYAFEVSSAERPQSDIINVATSYIDIIGELVVADFVVDADAVADVVVVVVSNNSNIDMAVVTC
jgi:hypothetical protein